ncbi:hypothetical protein MODO_0936 [Myroides odoratimimus]|uniref:Uncharacterized protein n=1 Tax=Myroides odoratimimus CIP 101113 TaxID=883154 RepID=A0AAV3F436_9FLAO|nr:MULTISPECIES: hypothetical protein [Myroides]AJA70034.1 hypothetical protein MYRA21_2925 [Myroides sp. A21]EHO12729.1 hypothetical protein HMPREF9715_01884 [Myroides odoratimimus CIP 101113]EKB07244.1 hypothetical protein HMPREF9711_00554 [Myroides odoratimimus CCUG 3837]EPH12234.1 hypothetical protein HMPREF9713_01075 [Myroides odoratimimus CCUG 12700]STZ48539.1 Uncharacterised protein [Myroides odoratimimus]
MEKEKMYQLGKIFCCAAIGVVVLAVVVKKKFMKEVKDIEDCISD